MRFFISLSLVVLISADTAFHPGRKSPRAVARVEKPVTVFEGKCLLGAKIQLDEGEIKYFNEACIAVTCHAHKLTVTEEYCDRVYFTNELWSLDFTDYLHQFPWCCPAFECAVPISK